MKIKDLNFELVSKGSYEFYKAKGVIQDLVIEENKNVKPAKWSMDFKSFPSFEDAVKWANVINLKHFNQEFEKYQSMIKEWEVK